MTPTCPKCGADMQERPGRRGVFLACVRYPACDGVQNVGGRAPRAPKTRSILASTTRLCPMQLACDGDTVLPGKTECGKCRVAAAKRARGTKLRGELTPYDRKKGRDE